jgi:hypothetical protein
LLLRASLQLPALADNLTNFLRPLTLPMTAARTASSTPLSSGGAQARRDLRAGGG